MTAARHMTMDELLQLPTVVDLRTAARALRIGEGAAYVQAASGKVAGCPVQKRGHKYAVTRPDLFRALGLDPGMTRAPEAEAS
jgi:hypothetical protein